MRARRPNSIDWTTDKTLSRARLGVITRLGDMHEFVAVTDPNDSHTGYYILIENCETVSSLIERDELQQQVDKRIRQAQEAFDTLLGHIKPELL